jgi:lipopolysaccharide transport system ATP-binding protein
VRLAFGVAAHLDPEILIVDEVLAVGDAEFQKKALGKMKDVSMKEGRTVLFVSHNMAAVKQLCTMGMIFENGKLVYVNDMQNTISNYYSRNLSKNSGSFFREGNKKVEFLTFQILDDLQNKRKDFLMGEDIFLKFSIQFNQDIEDLEIGLNVKNQNHDLMFHICNYDDEFLINEKKNCIRNILVKIPTVSLTAGNYILDVGAVIGEEKLDILEGFDEITIRQGPIIKRPGLYPLHTYFYSPSVWKNL